MTPSEAFKLWRPDTLVPSHEEAFEAGWKACAAFYDGKSALPLGGGEDYTSPRQLIDQKIVDLNLRGAPAITAEDVYNAYPRKVGKQAAIRAIDGAIKRLNSNGRGILFPAKLTLMERTTAYAAAVAKWPADDKQFIPHPATWFNRGSYDDDPKEWQRGTPTTQQIRSQN